MKTSKIQAIDILIFVLLWSSYLQVATILTLFLSYSLLFHWTSTAPSSWTSLSTLLSHMSTFHTAPTYSTCLHSREVCFWTSMQDLDWPWSLQPPESSLEGGGGGHGGSQTAASSITGRWPICQNHTPTWAIQKYISIQEVSIQNLQIFFTV